MRSHKSGYDMGREGSSTFGLGWKTGVCRVLPWLTVWYEILLSNHLHPKPKHRHHKSKQTTICVLVPMICAGATQLDPLQWTIADAHVGLNFAFAPLQPSPVAPGLPRHCSESGEILAAAAPRHVAVVGCAFTAARRRGGFKWIHVL